VQSIPVRPGDSRSLSAAGIMTIFETRAGQLWIGTHGGGVNVLDPLTGLVRQVPFGAGAVSAPSVTAIAEDRNGNLWIGSEKGLDRLKAQVVSALGESGVSAPDFSGKANAGH